jgi:hypothetical protein
MKISTTLATAVTVSLTLMGSTLCHAQEVSRKQLNFDRLDADKNGSLTLEEYTSIINTPERAAEFTGRDVDKNGTLTLKEFSQPAVKKSTEQPAAK